MKFNLVPVEYNGEEHILYSGPSREVLVVFPVGEFRLFAEIHEEAHAYTTYDIDPFFTGYLPEQYDYEALDINAEVQLHKADQSRVAQILLADVIFPTPAY